MGIIKTRTPKFKDVNSGEMENGGAPIYADDILRIQENASADVVNYYEGLRLKNPALMYYAGPGNPVVQYFENGLILSGCEYDNTNPLQPIVSPGYILSGGEICYYPGGTYTAGPSDPFLIYLFKGAATGTNRVFNDGGNKEILVQFDCVVETANAGAQGVVMPAGTAITATDQVVVISCGTNSANNPTAEGFFSIPAAMKINELGAQLDKGAWLPVTSVNANVDVTSNPPAQQQGVWCRVHQGFTEIVGSMVIDFTTLGGNPILFQLPVHNITGAFSTGFAGHWQSGSGSNESIECRLGVNLLGDVRFLTGASLPYSAMGNQRVSVSARIYGNQGYIPTADVYEYKKDFLNIT